MAEKNIKPFRIDMTAELKDDVDLAAEARGMSLKGFTEKTFEWLLRQDPDVQAVVLGQVSEDREILQLLLRRISSTPPTIRPAAKKPPNFKKGFEKGQ